MKFMETVADQLPEQGPATKTEILPWTPMAWFGVLVIATYFPILRHLVWQWSTDQDVGNGFFVPLVALFIVWQRREAILRVELKPAWWGVWILLWGAVQAYLGIMGAELFLQRTAFLITLTGV